VNIRENTIGYRTGDKKQPVAFFMLLFLFMLLFTHTVWADTINLEVTYGYQNTAKAGRFLPLSVHIENTMDKTFSGLIHVYMAQSDSNIVEYQYQSIVEGQSESDLNMTVSLGTGVNQILVTAETRDGELLGSRRIGLDVAGSDAELILGLLSDHEEKLSYLNGIGINEGLLKTRTVNLDPETLPTDETKLDQLDVLLISDYTMSRMRENEANVILRWVDGGGILVLGTGALGEDALKPYFSDLLNQPLDPMEMSVNMGEEYNNGTPGSGSVTMTASPVYLASGREALFSDVIPIISTVPQGAGLIAVSGYDFCDIQRFATENIGYVDQLFTAILGQNRLNQLSVSASEKSLSQYWDIQNLMNQSDVRNLPAVPLYALVLVFYVFLVGPGSWYFLRNRGAAAYYRPAIVMLSLLATIVIWVLGMNTRFSGTFLTYARLEDVSEDSVDETDFINLRSPYASNYGINIRTEYFVYPVLKGSDYTGDITEIRTREGLARTTIDYGRDHTTVNLKNTRPFRPAYFELHNKIPNSGGSFTAELSLTDGKLSGTIHNGTGSSLTDAALLIYGKLVKLGKLDAGQTIDVASLEIRNVAVGDHAAIAALVTGSSGRGFLDYYLRHNLSGYFSGARLVGFVRDNGLGFLENQSLESYGVTMMVSSLPVNTTADGLYTYSALSTNPEADSGDYDLASNTISGSVPAVLTYHLGEDESIVRIRVESLEVSERADSNVSEVSPFRGSMSFYNYSTGGFDVIDVGKDGILSGEQLTPYLNAENVLRVRFVSRGDNSGSLTREYLPMLYITAEAKHDRPPRIEYPLTILEEEDPEDTSDPSETAESGESSGTLETAESGDIPGTSETAESEDIPETSEILESSETAEIAGMTEASAASDMSEASLPEASDADQVIRIMG
jgi:hypothetical protein